MADRLTRTAKPSQARPSSREMNYLGRAAEVVNPIRLTFREYDETIGRESPASIAAAPNRGAFGAVEAKRVFLACLFSAVFQGRMKLDQAPSPPATSLNLFSHNNIAICDQRLLVTASYVGDGMCKRADWQCTRLLFLRKR